MPTGQTDGQMDGRQTVTISFPLDAASLASTCLRTLGGRLFMLSSGKKSLPIPDAVTMPSRSPRQCTPFEVDQMRQHSRKSAQQTILLA